MASMLNHGDGLFILLEMMELVHNYSNYAYCQLVEACMYLLIVNINVACL